jgi:hypothetical protein
MEEGINAQLLCSSVFPIPPSLFQVFSALHLDIKAVSLFINHSFAIE